MKATIAVTGVVMASVQNAATPDLVEDEMSFIAVHEFGVAQNAKRRTALGTSDFRGRPE
jgi:hypothetical protein